MRNVAPMKIAKIGYLAVSVALCGFGIQLLLNPNSSLQTIGVACGISEATLFGVTRLLFAVVKVPNCPSNWLFKSVVPEKRGK